MREGARHLCSSPGSEKERRARGCGLREDSKNLSSLNKGTIWRVKSVPGVFETLDLVDVEDGSFRFSLRSTERGAESFA